MLANGASTSSSLPCSEPFAYFENGNHNNKRKRRPAGTPDPDAEVVSLSPKTLLESDRYVCEICNQGFQRDQNLQMHRRRHKVPWKLLKRETPVVRKRVFVCPEPSCLHHDPCHALGDLVGIKKHFRRKHSNHKQWVCQKCSKGYAVQSDYKAHLKTCGTRGHSCDCGRVFSRVESFIEHQDVCHIRSESQEVQPACLSRTASSPSPSSETMFLSPRKDNNSSKNAPYHNLELQLLTTSSTDDKHSTRLQLSIGSSDIGQKTEPAVTCPNLETNAREQLKLAIAEKAYAEEARQQAKRLIELAEQEFAKAKRLRQQAQVELEKAQALRDHATKQINSTILQITCHACKQQLQERSSTPEENSLVVSYISSAITGTG
ncbi:hypothetical protein V6N13_077549 [Hibiscus sabdariffa]|uniref:C2H2-type domain-containing protein n=1 Tax=Hibiscus sabdariffa TaxID=183260 RepID=A0ABR2CP68_9ROSI